jgi:hypothetical protein
MKVVTVLIDMVHCPMINLPIAVEGRIREGEA